MIRALIFDERGRAHFQRRSAVALSAACLVANGMRETLCALFGAGVSVRLLQPSIPDANAWEVLFSGARLYAVSGALCEAAFVLRAHDALALAGAAFGESPDVLRELSAVEAGVLERTLSRLAAHLLPVCGAGTAELRSANPPYHFLTYFELLVAGAGEFRLGIALSREPAAARAGPPLSIEALLDVPIELRALSSPALLPAQALLDLRPGTQVPIFSEAGSAAGLLTAGGVAIAAGECGVSGARHAFAISGTARGHEFR